MADGLRGFQCEQNRNALTTLSGINKWRKTRTRPSGREPVSRRRAARGNAWGRPPLCGRACKRVGRRDGPGNAAFSFVNAITARDAPLCERTGEDAVQPAPAPPGSAGRGREEALARESAFTGASLAAR